MNGKFRLQMFIEGQLLEAFSSYMSSLTSDNRSHTMSSVVRDALADYLKNKGYLIVEEPIAFETKYDTVH